MIKFSLIERYNLIWVALTVYSKKIFFEVCARLDTDVGLHFLKNTVACRTKGLIVVEVVLETVRQRQSATLWIDANTNRHII